MSNSAVSTFVQEVNPELLVEVSGVPDRTPEVVAKPVVVNQSDFKVGDKINHPKWGNGMVVAVATSGPDLILSLAFPNQDIKKVMAHLAPIEKLC